MCISACPGHKTGKRKRGHEGAPNHGYGYSQFAFRTSAETALHWRTAGILFKLSLRPIRGFVTKLLFDYSTNYHNVLKLLRRLQHSGN